MGYQFDFEDGFIVLVFVFFVCYYFNLVVDNIYFFGQFGFNVFGMLFFGEFNYNLGVDFSVGFIYCLGGGVVIDVFLVVCDDDL